ncbi:MAG: hypothetical protein IIB12_01305 [Chloroflexi bacterium]|nr:hypothetical protein [Chloroflexota bacterium]
MCSNRIDKQAIGEEYRIGFDEYFGDELERLLPMISDELLTHTNEAIELTFLGRLFVRNIAMTFDAHLQKKMGRGERPLYSRTL